MMKPRHWITAVICVAMIVVIIILLAKEDYYSLIVPCLVLVTTIVVFAIANSAANRDMNDIIAGLKQLYPDKANTITEDNYEQHAADNIRKYNKILQYRNGKNVTTTIPANDYILALSLYAEAQEGSPPITDDLMKKYDEENKIGDYFVAKTHDEVDTYKKADLKVAFIDRSRNEWHNFEEIRPVPDQLVLI